MHLSVSVQIATQKGMLRYSGGGYVYTWNWMSGMASRPPYGKFEKAKIVKIYCFLLRPCIP